MIGMVLRRDTPVRTHEMTGPQGAPVLFTAQEVADILRTSRSAIYSMVERGQLPGVTRIGRRMLIRRDALLDWLDESRAPLLGGSRQ